MVHISCIMCPRDLPDIYTHALGPNGPRAWVYLYNPRAWMYISGKSLGYMIQLLLIQPLFLINAFLSTDSSAIIPLIHLLFPLK